MVTLLLTRSFTDSPKDLDDAARWAVLRERVLRELAYRQTAESAEAQEGVSLLNVIPATDAGHVCHECGKIVTWVEHLPPTQAGGPVRCFALPQNVVPIREDLPPGTRIVNGTGEVLYSADFLSSPEAT